MVDTAAEFSGSMPEHYDSNFEFHSYIRSTLLTAPSMKSDRALHNV